MNPSETQGLFDALTHAGAVPGAWMIAYATLAGLTMACLGFGVHLLSVPAGHPDRRRELRGRAVKLGVCVSLSALAWFVVVATSAGMRAERRVAIASACSDVAEAIASGKVGSISSSAQHVFEYACGTDRLVSAASTSVPPLRLH